MSASVIPSGFNKQSSKTNKDKLQSAVGKKASRFAIKMQLDAITTSDLIKLQHSPYLVTDDNKRFSRSTIMRRALNMYCDHFKHLVVDGNSVEIDKEFSVLMGMSKTSGHSTNKAVGGAGV